jgi:hypothetical protein
MILYLFPGALGCSLRASGPRPLGNRKQPSLEPRHHLRRGSVTPAHRPRRQEHGSRPPLRPQSGYAKSPTNDPSNDAASAPLGTRNTCSKYWGRCAVNLDSLPCCRGDVRVSVSGTEKGYSCALAQKACRDGQPSGGHASCRRGLACARSGDISNHSARDLTCCRAT